MKRNHFGALVALVCCVAITSCNNLEKEFQAYQQAYTQATETEAPAKYFPYEKVYVNVPDSMCSVVFNGQTKVATVYKSGYVLVPKAKATRADANEYTIVNVAYTVNDGVESKNSLEMVVAFEDTKTGDHDYNDLIFQAKLDIVNKTDGSNQTSAEITPIALGASRKIGLGVILTDAEYNVLLDKVIFENCRNEMFEGDTSFINTLHLPRKKYEPVQVSLDAENPGSVTSISWYIEVGGKKLFAANRFQACLDSLNMPQGLVLVNIREDEYFFNEGGTDYYCGNDFWQYPLESVDVSTVYPDFDKTFLSGGDFKCLATPAEGSKYYDAIMDDSLEVNDENCLYTLYKPAQTSSGASAGTVEAVQLWPGGPKWATCNVGASKPEEVGMYFSWGSIEGYAEVNGYKKNEWGYDGTLVAGRMFDETLYYQSTAGLLDEDYESGDIRFDAARANMGGNWRIPTHQEYIDLVDAKHTTYSWTNNYNETGVPGCIFTSKSDPTKFIFIPACGIINGDDRQHSDLYSNIWTSSLSDNYFANYATHYRNAWLIQCQDFSKAGNSRYQRAYGACVRAVCD